MNAPASVPPPAAPRASGFRTLHWVLIILAAFMVVAVVQAASVLMLAREARGLRQAVNVASDGALERKIELSVGPALLGLGRTVLQFVDDVPPEAHLALEAVRRGSVGIYTLKHSQTATQRVAMIRRSVAAMADRDWVQVVTVADGEDLVLIFVPRDLAEGDALEVCIAVSDGQEMVIASATVDAEPIQRLIALQHGELRDLVKL